MGAILPDFFALWEFSEFMPVKPSTNGIYYYLGTAPGETRASPQARSGKDLFELLAPSPCPSCLRVSLFLPRPQFPCLYYGERRVPRDWKCQSAWASKPGRLCSTGGLKEASGAAGMPPSLYRLPEKAASKEVGQTDFRWKRGLLLLHVLRGQR